MELKFVIGRNVGKYRKRRGWSQEELAHRCGMHTLEISRYERGRRDMRASTIDRLAKGLEIEPMELVRRK